MPLTITVQGQGVMVVEEFVYLGSLIHSATRITSVTLPAEVPSALTCHHWYSHAEHWQPDVEVMALYPKEIEALQQVHLTNIPEWFGLLGSRT